MEEKIYLELHGLDQSLFFELPQALEKKEQTKKEFSRSIFVNKLRGIQKYHQYFSRRRAQSDLCLVAQEDSYKAFIAAQLDANKKEFFEIEAVTRENKLQQPDENSDFLLPDITSTEFLREVVKDTPIIKATVKTIPSLQSFLDSDLPLTIYKMGPPEI